LPQNPNQGNAYQNAAETNARLDGQSKSKRHFDYADSLTQEKESGESRHSGHRVQ
jgi:hypothetical protein